MSQTTTAYQARRDSFKLKPQTARDSYKLSHEFQFPQQTRVVYSNFTPRSAKHFKVPAVCNFDGKISWLGLQGTMMEYNALWQEQFFNRPWDEVAAEYTHRTTPFLGKAPDLTRLKALHDLGVLPLHVKQIPEGSYLNIGVPAFTVVNTQPNTGLFGWLTNATETYLSNESWKLPTVATIATAYRRLFDHYAELTGGSLDFVDWQGHCFADRGMSGMMDAAKNCSGHSVAFLGSDSVSSADWITWAYFAEDNLIAGSVPASEHAVSSLNIAVFKDQMKQEVVEIREKMPKLSKYTKFTDSEFMAEAEYHFMKRYITEVYPTGVASYVADTYDFFRVITEIAPRLKEEILARQPDANGLAKVVFRPDSGDPVEILCGIEIPTFDEAKDLDAAKNWAQSYYIEQERENTEHGMPGSPEVEGYFRYQGHVYWVKVEIEWNRHDKQYYYMDGNSILDFKPAVLNPKQKGAVECLWDIFGGTVTEKGFKQLHERVGLIYGDSITLERADQIMQRLMAKGFASTNWVAGIGLN